MSRSKRPWWLGLLVIILILPVTAQPALLSAMPADGEYSTLALIYPIYAAGSCALAWICWPGRRELSWILLILTALSHAAIWLLAIG